MLNVIRYIQNHKEDWREKLSGAPWYLSISEDEDYALLKYNQIKSDFSRRTCCECRGLIVDLHTLQPAALSFFRFLLGNKGSK